MRDAAVSTAPEAIQRRQSANVNIDADLSSSPMTLEYDDSTFLLCRCAV